MEYLTILSMLGSSSLPIENWNFHIAGRDGKTHKLDFCIENFRYQKLFSLNKPKLTSKVICCAVGFYVIFIQQIGKSQHICIKTNINQLASCLDTSKIQFVTQPSSFMKVNQMQKDKGLIFSCKKQQYYLYKKELPQQQQQKKISVAHHRILHAITLVSYMSLCGNATWLELCRKIGPIFFNDSDALGIFFKTLENRFAPRLHN